MTTDEIMNLDYRKEENRKIIQKVLRQIKPLSKYSDEYDIPFEAIEKAISVMCKKYNIMVRDITLDVWANEKYTIWKATIVVNDKVVDAAFGIVLYEVIAKTAIRLYAEIKRGASKRS